MKKARFFLTIALTIFVVSFIGKADLAAESYEEEFYQPVAQVTIGANGIAWSPVVNYASIELRVSGPNGAVFSKSFGSGESLYLGLSDNNGKYFTDGSYTYELRVNPVVSNRVRTSDDPGISEPLDAAPQQALVQSGGFMILGGSFVTTSTPEAGLSAPMDQVIIDDLIVDGSACIGQDCVNGESFGFDTLRLKENNLRIKFQDTSSTASFPSNDWQLTANDSSNGGLNKFSIDDVDGGKTPFTLEAGAPSHSLYVDDGGKVGFGTSTPVVDLHAVSGNTPTLRLEQDGSSGFSPQTWDVAGNETNFFIRDATNGSKLPFKIKPGAPNNSLFIAADGDIGLGTQSPGFPIHLITDSSTNATFVAERTSGALCYVNATDQHGNFGTTSDHPVRIISGGTTIMTVNETGDYLSMIGGGTYNGTWNPSSSRELKENIANLSAEEALDAINELEPVKYNYKRDKEEPRVGFIAEDVPDIVALNGRKQLATVDIVAVLTKVVKEQQETISELKNEIAEIKKK
jgi:hypothetical protein